jgi:hypothetical protein
MLITGCDPHDGRLTIVNNSSDTIIYNFSFNKKNFTLPVNKVDGVINYQNVNIIFPHDENSEPIMGNWEDFINNNSADRTLVVYFFTKNLIETIGKDSIIKNQINSKEVRVKVAELKNMNWLISYNDSL